MSKLRIVMIEQDQATYKRISDLLNDELAIEMIKFTNQRKKGFELIKKYKPDIALIDICFIKESDWNESPFSSLPIIILARPLVDEVAKTLRAISLGAVDFINKKDLYERSFKQDLMFKINNAFKRKKSHSSVRLNKRANDKYELSKEVT